MSQSSGQSGQGNQGFDQNQMQQFLSGFYHQNLDQLFGQGSGQFDTQRIRQHLDELVGPTLQHIQGKIPQDALQAFIQEVGTNYSYTWVQQKTQQDPQWGQIWTCLTQEMPQYYLQTLLPQYADQGVGAEATAGSSLR